MNSGGKFLYKLTRKQLVDALAAAQKEHKHQLVGDMHGYQLYALFTQDVNLHELQLHDANHGYDYIFILCAWPQS